jgi:membrane-associated phospholipid phosphatase
VTQRHPLHARIHLLVAGVCALAAAPLPAQELGPEPHLPAAALLAVPLSPPDGWLPPLPLAVPAATGEADRSRLELGIERRLLPPGLLRYRVPEGARSYVLPYAAVGTVLLFVDEPVLRTLKLDSLFLRQDGTAAAQAHVVFRSFSRLGDPPVVALLLAGLYAFGGSHERDAARVGGVAYANAITMTMAGKFLIGKERPYVSGGRIRYHGPNPRHASIPSGHSSGTAAVAHVLAHFYPDEQVLWYGLSGMTGISRIALARHWPSDVWWGWGVGLLGADGALRERQRIERWRPW